MTPRETQPERTALAGSRTGASIFVLGFVLLRLGLLERGWLLTVLALAALTAGVVEIFLSYRDSRRAGPGMPVAAMSLAAAVVLASLGGVVAALTID